MGRLQHIIAHHKLPLTTQPGINYYFIAYQVPSDYGTLGPFTVKSSLGQIPYTSVIVNVGATPTSSAVAVSASNPYTSRTISGFTRSSAQPTPTHGTSDLSSTGAQSSLSTGAIAGISVGATVGLCYIKRKKKPVQQQEPTVLIPEKDNMGAMSIQMNAPQFVTTPPAESQYSNNFLPPYPEPFNSNNQQQHQQVMFSSNIESTTDFTSNASSTPLNAYNGDNLMYGKTMVSEDSAPERLTVNDPTSLLMSSNNSYPICAPFPFRIIWKTE
ncbi:hypothetical protein RO3G_00607 [Rhizopus delemar RA 99-880]|uniref:Uncharacterized protein n=1 Tax=Rhizopus delemar (strain RA 99-880 / ATCC MYA-4621 / FGSC 9543 / NRRL 43880) TaxID=246409 RepID=I1BI73_RHIO9|nr:hypothetical protein RO3G_00607 [Rhizopus delemar RA 99-880]|eukprot:EIE75903.1 hypothetical protein RO3G_00607 [Rhizopus delemar RA 99-880]